MVKILTIFYILGIDTFTNNWIGNSSGVERGKNVSQNEMKDKN